VRVGKRRRLAVILSVAFVVGFAGLAVLMAVARTLANPEEAARWADPWTVEPIGGTGPSFLHLSPEPIYLQTDPRWGSERIGGSGERLAEVGCVVCCLSMALTHHGIDIPPDALNRLLADNGGYTESGWVVWSAISTITGDRIAVRVPPRPSHALIDQALGRGDPVVAKVVLAGGASHWVLIVGREGREYLVKDPLGDGRSLEPLSGFGSPIHSIRIVGPGRAGV